MMKAKKLNYSVAALILAVVLVLELLMSNFTFIAYVAGRTQVSDVKPVCYSYISANGTIEDNFLAGDLGFDLNSVSFRIKADNDEMFDVTAAVLVDDESTGAGFYEVAKKTFAVTSDESVQTVYLNSSGKADAVAIHISGYEGDFTLSDVTVNPQYKFSFNVIRFLLISISVCLIYAVKNRNEDKKIADFLKTRRALAVLLAFCVAATVFVAVLNSSSSSTAPVSYPLENPVDNYNPYIQQFDAFQKGQLHLDVEPSQELLELENPYKPSEREGIYYLWDRAFYEGKYYSYFGLTPIFTLYYPVYLITGSLPSDNFVISVYAFTAAVFFALAVMQFYKNSSKKTSPYFAAACTAFAFLSSFVLIIFRGNSRFYYIASIAGMAFSAAFIYFMLKAMGESKDRKRCLWFALAGISFALAFHSRVNSVLPLALTAVVFVIRHVVRSLKDKKLVKGISECAVLGIPVAAGVAVSLIYNHIRFGSIFDFGTAYQLTVTDTSLYTVSMSGLLPSLFHYFIQPFTVTAEFPYIGLNYINLGNYGRYTYVDSGIGIFAFPFNLMLLASPVLFKSKSLCKGKKTLLAVSLLSLVITAFFDFCMGGVIYRYTADISLFAAFLAAVIAIEFGGIVAEKYGKNALKIYCGAVCALGAVTAVIALGASFIPSGNFVNSSPVVFEAMKDFFVFFN